ncbi:MAG: hypothetical protein PVS3B1_32680 [Ktedonobacteraceae bacterium]
MSIRIAHRPRYRTTHKPVPSLFHTKQPFLRTRWKYRSRSLAYEKHALGHQLSLLPLRHRLMQHLVLYQAF